MNFIMSSRVRETKQKICKPCYASYSNLSSKAYDMHAKFDLVSRISFSSFSNDFPL